MQNIVVIGGSAGSIEALKVILNGLPPDFPAAVLVVVHVGARESVLPGLLDRCSSLPVRHATQGELLVPGQVLVAPPDLHLTVAVDGGRRFAQLSRGPKENHARPAIDPLSRSAAAACGADAIAVVLSGFMDDGTVGLQAIKARGGVAVVQDPQDAEVLDMPASALQHAAVDLVRRAADIAAVLVQLLQREQVAPDNELQDWITVESRMFDEGAAMEDMDRIGSRTALTCPECGGAIWEIQQAQPLRYRCHTGHAFTARVLEALQGGKAEEALWAALRALREQERLYRDMHRRPQQGDAAGGYLHKAEQAAARAQLLRDMIATGIQIGPP